MNQMIILAICGGIIVITSFLLIYYIYHLVLLDATSRGINHPKFWSLFAAGGQNGGGLIFYLFKRRNSFGNLSKADAQKSQLFKRKIYCLMAVDLVAFLIFIAAMVQMG